MNDTIVVKVKRLDKQAQLPLQARAGDAAFDLFSAMEYTIRPGESYGVNTGIALEIPVGYEGQVRPRSGLALNNGITVTNAPGTIDSGYRGEVKVVLHNLGRKPFQIECGMRVAQIAIRPVPDVRFVEVEELADSERGDGGFGSTGT
jgi:dUTP pyrophosphatase